MLDAFPYLADAARARLLVGELGPVRTVHLCLFSGAPLRDRSVLARVERGEVLHFSIEELYDRA